MSEQLKHGNEGTQTGSCAEIWIPARLGSSRLKEKLLRVVRGRPVLAYTLDNAARARLAALFADF